MFSAELPPFFLFEMVVCCLCPYYILTLYFCQYNFLIFSNIFLFSLLLYTYSIVSGRMEYQYSIPKTLMQIFRSIFPIAQVQNAQRSPLRLRSCTCAPEDL